MPVFIPSDKLKRVHEPNYYPSNLVNLTWSIRQPECIYAKYMASMLENQDDITPTFIMFDQTLWRIIC